MTHVNTTGIGEGGTASVHALLSARTWLFLSDSGVSAQVTHGPANPRHTHLGAFPGLGSFIVPGARVLAERPPHADPVTGGAGRASWQQQGGRGAPEAAIRICQQFRLCRALASLLTPGVSSLNKSTLTPRTGKLSSQRSKTHHSLLDPRRDACIPRHHLEHWSGPVSCLPLSVS